MSDEAENFGCCLVLDFRIWWRNVKTFDQVAFVKNVVLHLSCYQASWVFSSWRKYFPDGFVWHLINKYLIHNNNDDDEMFIIINVRLYRTHV